MPSVVKQLTKKGLISPPKFLPDNVHYETIMGSVAYGVSSDTSDCDVYGFCIPEKHTIFPWIAGEVPGFGRQKKRFDQYQKHHVKDESSRKEYDLTIYSIVKFFDLCLENNPNMVDSLFTPQNCVLHITQIGQMVRDSRKIFLHKGCFHKFRGYAHSQLHKIRTKTPEEGSKRHKNVEEHGYDTKFAYHVVRLVDECEQILTLGDLDLQRSREILKEIRRGEWPEEKLFSWFDDAEKRLEKVYNESDVVPWGPDEDKIKELLLNCLEHHFGDLSSCVHKIEKDSEKAISEICDVIRKYNF